MSCGTYRILGNYAYREGTCGCGTTDNCCTCDPIQTTNIIYSSSNLPCSGVNTCDTMDTVLQKIDAKLCELALAIYNLGTTTTTSTTAAP